MVGVHLWRVKVDQRGQRLTGLGLLAELVLNALAQLLLELGAAGVIVGLSDLRLLDLIGATSGRLWVGDRQAIDRIALYLCDRVIADIPGNTGVDGGNVSRRRLSVRDRYVAARLAEHDAVAVTEALALAHCQTAEKR